MIGVSFDSSNIKLIDRLGVMAATIKKTRVVNGIGDTGKQVAENVKRLRGGMTYKELSARLAEVGREITVLGLRRIEAGERKVDVDDLMALAVVFGVSPLTLLLPISGNDTETAEMTGHDGKLGCNVMWSWAIGAEPLRVPASPTAYKQSVAKYRRQAVPQQIGSRATPKTTLDFLTPEAQELFNRNELSKYRDNLLSENGVLEEEEPTLFSVEPLNPLEKAALDRAIEKAGEVYRDYFMAQNYGD